MYVVGSCSLSRDCDGISEVELGSNLRSGGALPGGRVCALNEGAVSLPTRIPGLCCETSDFGCDCLIREARA